MIRRIKKREFRKRKINSFPKRNKWEIIKSFIKDKYFLISFLTFIVAALTLYFVIIQYESPPEVKCSIDLVQRPDSIFQFHLHIWNEGDQIANEIIIKANGKDVFQWDTSKVKGKSPLYVYPIFSVYFNVAAGNNDFHQLTIPQLSKSNRDDNYLIICPHVYKIDYYKALPNLILREKFINLKSVPNVKNYFAELTENLKVFYAGNSLPFEIENKIDLTETGNYNFFYPTYEQFTDYRQRPINSNNTEEKKKNDKKDDSWFPFF